MTTTTETAPRFTLNEDRARDWIAAAIAASESDGPRPNPAALPDIHSGYCASSGHYSHETARLVQAAFDAGIITDPAYRDQATVAWEFTPAGDGTEPGYRWILYTDVSDEPEDHVIVTTGTEEMWTLDDGANMRGAQSALQVLRQAVEYGNTLADDLARYAAARQLAARAPELGGESEGCTCCQTSAGSGSRRPHRECARCGHMIMRHVGRPTA